MLIFSTRCENTVWLYVYYNEITIHGTVPTMMKEKLHGSVSFIMTENFMDLCLL